MHEFIDLFMNDAATFVFTIFITVVIIAFVIVMFLYWRSYK